MVKKHLMIIFFLSLLSIHIFSGDNRYNENMHQPQEVGGGGNVSNQTGALNLSSTDLSLPGMNGLDFSVSRSYSSSQANVYNMKTDSSLRSHITPHTPGDWKYGLGCGWSFSWPYLFRDIDDNGAIQKLNLFRGGRVYEIDQAFSMDKGENNIKYYYVNDIRIYPDESVVYTGDMVDDRVGALNNLNVRSKYCLELKNKTRYYFSEAGNLMVIRIPGDTNDIKQAEIWFYYKEHVVVTNHDEYAGNRSSTKIELVVDSVGRVIDFVYKDGEENWLESIKYNVNIAGIDIEKVVKYYHDNLSVFDVKKIDGENKVLATTGNKIPAADYKFNLSGFANPMQVAEGEAEITKYNYGVYEADFSFSPGMGRNQNYFVNTENIYSYYEYDDGNDKDFFKNSVTFEYNQPLGNWSNYKRKFANGFMENFKVTREYYLSKSTVETEPDIFNDTNYEYYGNSYGMDLNEYWTIIKTGGPEKKQVYGSSSIETDDNLLKYEETETNGGGFLERVDYTYDIRKCLKNKSMYRSGVHKYTEKYIYDNDNDLVNHTAPNGLVTITSYHPVFHTPVKVVQEGIRNGDGTTYDVVLENELRETDGKIISRSIYATVDGAKKKIKVQEISYDGYGNPVELTDALGHSIRTYYDSTFHIFPEKVEMEATLDGVLQTVRGIKLFNSDGSIWIEADNDGYAIERHYDLMGTEVKTIMPDEDDLVNGISNVDDLLSVDWQASRANNSFIYIEPDYRNESVLTFGEEFNGVRVKTGRFADGLGHVLKEVVFENSDSDTEYSVKNIAYDNRGNMVALTDPDAGSDYITRSVMGRDVRVYDKTWLVWYDDLGRKIKVEYPGEGSRIIQKTVRYDDVNLRATTRNTRGYKTIEEYDIDGNLVSISRPDVTDYDGVKRELVYRFEYNQLKKKIGFTDTLGETVRYIFDERGLMTQLDYSNGSDFMTYNDVGNLTTKIDRNKSLVKFYYDEMNRNIKQEYYTRDSYDILYDEVELGYNGRGHPVKVYGQELIEEMVYDSRARIKTIDRTILDPAIRADLAANVDWILSDDIEYQKLHFSFTYTPNNLVDSMTLPNGKVTQYHYDENKLRLLGMDTDADLDANGTQERQSIVSNLLYNKAGQVVRMDYGNNTSQYWDFDRRSRIKNTEVISAGNRILKLEYKIDGQGNILRINDNTYSYDEVDRVIKSDVMRLGNIDYRVKVAASFGTSSLEPLVGNRVFNETVDFNEDSKIDGYDHIQGCREWANQFDSEGFVYDHNGNRRKLLQNDGEYVYHYGERNRLLQIERVEENGTGKVILDYVYDANGNTIRKCEYNNDGGKTVYNFQYDINNRLVKVLKGDGITRLHHGEYIYDSAGMRIYKNENGKRTYYARNGGTVLYEIEIDETGPETGMTENTYVVSGELIAGRITRKNGGAEELFYYHLDHLNSTKMVTNRSGEVVLEYEYRAFGTELDRIGDDKNRFSYIGREFDEEINLYYVNARYYDATIGRFVNVDPIQDGTNWYVYCRNNPLSRIDPTGLSDFWSKVSFGASVIGLGFCSGGLSYIVAGAGVISSGISLFGGDDKQEEIKRLRKELRETKNELRRMEKRNEKLENSVNAQTSERNLDNQLMEEKDEQIEVLKMEKRALKEDNNNLYEKKKQLENFILDNTDNYIEEDEEMDSLKILPNHPNENFQDTSGDETDRNEE